MVNLFQKHKLLFAIAVGFFILAIIALISYSRSRTEVSNQDLSTPELIDQAFARGQITEEKRLLYLAYALYEPESLPVRYRSRVGWFGDVGLIREIDEVVNSPSELCSMSPHVRSELLRLIKKTEDDTVCN